MRLRRGWANFALIGLLIFSLAWFIELSPASDELEFQVIGSGDMSGQREENYLVVRTETDWETLWATHVIFVTPAPPVPEIDFSSDLVVCAFMGTRSTGGYSISIEKIWTSEGEVYVDVVKRRPSPDWIVIQVVTFPYVFASMEKTEMDFTFNITDEYGTIFDCLIPRPPDVTGDNYCGIDDIVEVAVRFGSTCNRHDWHPKYDISRDSYVGIDDLIVAVCHFGKMVC